MIKLLILFAHLLAVCTALGAIIATDLRLLGKLADKRMRLAPPNEFVMRLVGGSLAVLYATGALLLWFGYQDNAETLNNPKLQGKLLFVGLLTLNAVLLHVRTFPWLAQARRVSSWGFSDGLWVALPIAASNSLWLYCAFLGIARPWNHVVPLHQVLAAGAIVFLMALAGVLAVLALAARSSGPARRDRLLARHSRRGEAEPQGLGAALGS